MVHSQLMDHAVHLLANANGLVCEMLAMKKCVKAVQVDGPQFWDGDVPTRHQDKMQLQHHSAGIGHCHFAFP